MKKNQTLHSCIKLILLCFIFKLNAQTSESFTGTYKFGNNIEVEPVGQILVVPEKKDTYFIWLEVSKAAPSYSTSSVFTKLTLKNNSSEYLSIAHQGCRLKFEFSKDKINIKDLSTLNWGSANVSRTYAKINSDTHKFFILGNGKQVPFSENSNYFSENCYNKTKTYIWGEGLCDYTGTYNPSNFNDVQLQRAFEISDVYSTDKQNVFSSWNNLKNEDQIDDKIIYFKNRYNDIKNKILKLEQIPVNNPELWDAYISANLKAMDDVFHIHKLLLKSYYQPKSLVQSEYYPLIKKATDVLNSNDKAIKKYYDMLSKNDLEKVSTIVQMRKYIFSQKIENILFDTIPLRNLLFQKLFISIEEECSDGPY